jgi:hypothetical protein
MNQRTFRVLILLVVFCLAGSLAAGPAVAVTSEGQATPTPAAPQPPGRPEPPTLPQVGADAAASAPGYCASYGGSTAYEALTGIDVTRKQDGTIQIITHVYIANPVGCTAGTACPSYDQSPEYVNLWIDWNQNKSWEANEKVIDAALTGYKNINYHGDMTYAALIVPPTTAVSGVTWLRGNVGWSTDPNDPCLQYWTWGNVLDRQIESSPPSIKNITSTGLGTANNQPETGSKVRLEAELVMPSGYTLEECSWTGDLSAGKGDKANKCAYEYTPATGAGPDVKTYGEKNVTLTIGYKHTASGITGSVNRTHKYKVFFKKFGDDDGDCAWGTFWNGCEKNWFSYWKDDGAVPGLNAGHVKYGNYSDPTIIGGFDRSTHLITLGDRATESDGSITIPKVNDCPDTYTFPGGKGINLTALTLAHENYHKLLDANWHENQPWYQKTDSDQDRLPDDYETDTTKTKTDNADTCNLAGEISGDYATYGDNELQARRAELGVTGVAQNDWANPGAQTNPAYAAAAVELAAPAPAVAVLTGGYDAALLSAFTGNYSDGGLDTNGNGLYDVLRVIAGVQVDAAGDYLLIADLADGAGSPITSAVSPISLSAPGTYNVELLFDGKQIRHHAVNGPYKLARLGLYYKEGFHSIEELENPYTTGAYASSAFEPTAAGFNNTYGAVTQDTGGDGLFDLLNISVGVNAQAAGTYTLYGELYGTQVIGTASAAQTLTAGNNTVTLSFSGQQIYFSKQNGPYLLKNLRIKNALDVQTDFIKNAYTTSAYSYTLFQHGSLYIQPSGFSSQGIDANANALYDFLRINFTVNVNAAGQYPIKVSLKDSQGNAIGEMSQTFNLVSGANKVPFDFPGGKIRSTQVNGPYQVTAVSLFDPAGALADVYDGPYVTGAYQYTSFDNPLVSIGTITFQPGDGNGNGKYEYLIWSFPVYTGAQGSVKINSFITDAEGNILFTFVAEFDGIANTTRVIKVVMWGSDILAKQKVGPYVLRDLNIYHSADLNQSVSLDEAHTTPAYLLSDFEQNPRQYMPILAR